MRFNVDYRQLQNVLLQIPLLTDNEPDSDYTPISSLKTENTHAHTHTTTTHTHRKNMLSSDIIVSFKYTSI